MGIPTVELTIFSSDRTALSILFFLSFVYFLENFDRSLISVSPIPYIDYGSYEYSVLAGPAFTIVYTLGGVFFALLSFVNQPIEGAAKKTSSISMGKFYILSLTTLVFSVAFASTAFALYFWQQVIIRIVMGLAQSIITPFSTSIISEYFPPAMRGSAFGIFNSGTYFSFSLSLSLGIYIYVEYGWQAGYIIFGMIGVACSLVMPIFSCFRSNADSEDSVDLSKEQQEQRNLLHPDVTVTDGSYNSSVISDSPGIQHRKGRDMQPVPVTQADGQSDDSSSDEIAPLKPVWRRMVAVVYDIVCVHWRAQPGIYMLCLATGVRIGAGYVWVSYTGAFFSDLFETEDTSCDYSYNGALSMAPPSNMCDSDYPYCVDGECSKLTSFPWHNKGMDSIHLVEYMAWVPIVGSAFGNVLGGFVSDYFIGRKTSAGSRQSSNDSSADESGAHKADRTTSTLRDVLLPGTNKTAVPVPDRQASAASTYEDSVSNTDVQSRQGFASHLFDSSHSSRHSVKDPVVVDQSLRMLIAGWSNILPVPLIICALLLEFPYCFLIMIASGMMGEMYMGQALATITDATVTPTECLTPAVALFMFVITIIGGNVPLLIPLVSSAVGYAGDVDISFQAASMYNATITEATNEEFTVHHQDARQLQYSMIYVLGGCYGMAGVMYLISYWQIKSSHNKISR